MTALLAFGMVAAFGTWIPLAQLLPGVPQRTRTFYATVGNVVVAAIALLAGGGHLVFGWRGFWLPLAGGVVWTAGGYCAFRASETIGIARAAGTWTPLNIIVAFAWGALIFGELSHFPGIRFVLLAAALAAILAGIFLIVRSQDSSGDRVVPAVPPAAQAIETEPVRPAPGRAAACCGQARRGCCGGVTSCPRSGPRNRPRSATSRWPSGSSWPAWPWPSRPASQPA